MNLSRNLFTRLMRVFFYLLYQPFAWTYDRVADIVSWGRWQAWVLSVLPYLHGPKVLELGLGPGHLQQALKEKGIAASGLDASRQMCRQADIRLRKQGLTATHALGYAQRIPFCNQCFDQIVATFPTEYIYAPDTLNEIFRTLKPEGELLVLPAAWITGKKWADQATAALFRLTDQAPKWDASWLVPFEQAGFQTKFQFIHQTDWSLVIIIAKKPNHP